MCLLYLWASLSGKEPACQSRRCGFNPWVGKIPWRRKWKPTPVFLPGKSHGQKSLAGYSPWGHKESDMTEQLNNNNSKMRLWQGGKGFFIMRSTFKNIYADCLKKKENKRYGAEMWSEWHKELRIETTQLFVWLLRRLSGKESACQSKRGRFNPWGGKSLWRRKWKPTPVFLPGKSQGQRNLVGYNLWGHKRSGHDFLTKQQQQIC